MNTEFIKRQTARLPSYWKLATIRCAIYAIVVGVNAFEVGVEGFDTLSAMTPLQLGKLALHVLIAVLGVWLAFLDQTLTQIRNPVPNPPANSNPPAQS